MARVKNYIKGAKAITGTAVQQIGDIFPITHLGARALRVDLVGTYNMTGATSTLKLQTSPDNINWSDVKSTANIATGAQTAMLTIKAIDTVAADAAVMPLGQVCRVVTVFSNAADTCTFTGLFVQQ